MKELLAIILQILMMRHSCQEIKKQELWGIGIDYKLSKKPAYFSDQIFSFEDINFILDKSDGLETTLEIKVNFKR